MNMPSPARSTIAVYGGSFDPPHVGHVLLPTYVLSLGLADRVLVCPANTHTLGKQLRPFTQRLAWVRAAMEVHGSGVEVSAIEGDLARDDDPGGAPPGSSLALLSAVARENPGHRVRLVVGSDITATGETARWHRWEEIERRFDPIVVPRAGFGDMPMSLPEVSSAAVNEALARGRAEDLAMVRASVPARVLRELLPEEGCGRLVVVGGGNVGVHACRWLRATGWQVERVSGRALCEGTATPTVTAADGVWVLVSDPHIPAVGAALVRAGLDPTTPVLHGAGAIRADSELGLAAVRAHGNAVGTLHPICALRREVDWHLLDACVFGVGGDDAAIDLATRLVPAVRHLDLRGLSDAARVRYHGACALAANFMGPFQALATEELVDVGAGRPTAHAAVTTLMRSSLANLAALGMPLGVTGPVARGDMATVDRHVRELQGTAATVYRSMSQVLSQLLADDSPG